MLGIKDAKNLAKLAIRRNDRNSNHVEKLHTIQRVKNFDSHGLMVSFDALGTKKFQMRRMVSIFKKAENKVSYNMTKWRIFEPKYFNIRI